MTFAPTGGVADYFYLTSSTMQQMEIQSPLWDNWTWDPPRQPMPYTQPKSKEVLTPHIRIRAQRPFRAHKFRLGGSKK